jgi:hypothetical protein
MIAGLAGFEADKLIETKYVSTPTISLISGQIPYYIVGIISTLDF